MVFNERLVRDLDWKWLMDSYASFVSSGFTEIQISNFEVFLDKLEDDFLASLDDETRQKFRSTLSLMKTMKDFAHNIALSLIIDDTRKSQVDSDLFYLQATMWLRNNDSYKIFDELARKNNEREEFVGRQRQKNTKIPGSVKVDA